MSLEGFLRRPHKKDSLYQPHGIRLQIGAVLVGILEELVGAFLEGSQSPCLEGPTMFLSELNHVDSFVGDTWQVKVFTF